MGFWSDFREGFNDGSQSMIDEVRRILFGYDEEKSDDKKTIDAIEEKWGGTIPEEYRTGQSGLVGDLIDDKTVILLLGAIGALALFTFITK